MRRLVGALTALVLVAAGLAGYAFQQRGDTISTGRTATSREVAAEADQLRTENPPLADQLSVAAYRVAHTTDAAASVLTSTASPTASRLRDSAGVMQAVALARTVRCSRSPVRTAAHRSRRSLGRPSRRRR